MLRLIRGLINIPTEAQGGVVTLGGFDGVHLGHQALIRDLQAYAQKSQRPAVVIGFEPQPNEYFQSALAPARLTRLREKWVEFNALGLQYFLCLRFSAVLAGWEAEKFIDRVLIQGLAIRHLVVGDDFRFGKNRRGDFALLQAAGARYGFQVSRHATVDFQNQRISSSRVREALGLGNFALAKELLGRPYAMSGRVVHGQKRGRTLGFPTANIYLHRSQSPLLGVYAVRVRGLDPLALPGVANIGVRPTVNGECPLLEVHLFDFDRTIYGSYVQVEFVQKLRDEKKFASLDELKGQIHLDVLQARQCFNE